MSVFKALGASTKSAQVVLKFLDLIREDVWPDERGIVFRPERLKYVRKIIRPKGCVFCTAAKSQTLKNKLVLYRTDDCMVVLNKYPYNNGHILVMPTSHTANLEDLGKKNYLELSLLVRDSVEILKKAYKCQGVNVGLNLGQAAGAGIPDHIHYHIIPRWGGDTNFFPLIAQTKLVVETLETTYKKLEPYFQKLY